MTFIVLQASPRYNATSSSLNQTTNTNITTNSALNNTLTNPFASVEYITQSTTELDVSTLDFTSTRSLRLLGFTLVQLRDSKCFDLRDLLGAGFPLNEVKNLKSTLYVNITAKDLRLAGYSAHEVRTLVVSCLVLNTAPCFSLLFVFLLSGPSFASYYIS